MIKCSGNVPFKDLVYIKTLQDLYKACNPISVIPRLLSGCPSFDTAAFRVSRTNE